MAAIWTWRQSEFSLNQTVDAAGAQLLGGAVINPPESIQRFILRVGVGFFGSHNVDVNFAEFSPGVVRVYTWLEDESFSQLVISQAVPVAMSFLTFQMPDGGPVRVAAYGAAEPLSYDMRLRRAAPPPPASGLQLNIRVDWIPTFPGGANEAYFSQMFGSADFTWLTSQPGS